MVLARRGRIDSKLNKNVEFKVTGGDITSRDNGELSKAAYYMVDVLSSLRDRSLISNEEFLRVVYRFFGETVDASDMLAKSKSEMDEQQGKTPAGEKPDRKIIPEKKQKGKTP